MFPHAEYTVSFFQGDVKRVRMAFTITRTGEKNVGVFRTIFGPNARTKLWEGGPHETPKDMGVGGLKGLVRYENRTVKIIGPTYTFEGGLGPTYSIGATYNFQGPTFRNFETIKTPLGHVITGQAMVSDMVASSSLPESSSSIADPIIWRCISYRALSSGMGGRFAEVMFDDLVPTWRLTHYFEELQNRGVDKITVKRLGPQSWVQENISEALRVGAKRIAHEKKIRKLEEF